MFYELAEKPEKKSEVFLEEISHLLWNEQYTCRFDNVVEEQEAGLRWMRFLVGEEGEKDECVIAFQGAQKGSQLLSLMKMLCDVSDRVDLQHSIRFDGFAEAPERSFRYQLHSQGTGELGLELLMADNGFHPIELNAPTDEVCAFQLPFTLALDLPAYGGDRPMTVACARAKIHFASIHKTFDLYTYFQKGEMEMDIMKKEQTEDLDTIPVEFVLGDFSMDIMDALSLRPGDRISIDVPEEIQGVIRIGGGDWVRASLTLEDGQAVISVKKRER